MLLELTNTTLRRIKGTNSPKDHTTLIVTDIRKGKIESAQGSSLNKAQRSLAEAMTS